MRRLLTAFFLITSMPVVTSGQLNIISTFAGGGPNARTALSAEIIWPAGVAIDKHGNTYVCAAALDEVLKIDRLRHVTVVAGTGYAGYSGDGHPATSAALQLSGGYIGTTPAIALDASGNLFISDTVNSVVRRVDAATGIIMTVAGNGTAGYSGDSGPATSASLNFPGGIALDALGDLFIADGNSVIRRVDAVTGIITTVAGNYSLAGTYSGDTGLATDAGLYYPQGVALDPTGNLFIADTYNNVVRRVDALTGVITTVAGDYSMGGSYSGDGYPATNAGLNQPCCVTLDASDNVFIGDAGNEVVRRVDASSDIITTVAGSGPGATGFGGFSGDGGPATSAQLNLDEGGLVSATGIAVDASGDLLIPDTYSNRVRRVDGKTGVITTMAGGGSGGDGGRARRAILAFPASLALDRFGNLFVDDLDADRIRRVDAMTGDVSTVTGNGIFVWDSVTNDVPATTAGLNWPIGLAVDGSGNLFISDSFASRIRRVDADTGIISTVAGGGSTLGDGGPATSARINQPHGVAVDKAGNFFIGDTMDNRVRRVDAVTGIITTVVGTGTYGFSGDGGPATLAKLAFPRGVVVDRSGNLFFSDSGNSRIRRVDAATGIITTIAGNGTSYSGDGGPATNAGIGLVEEIALDSLGNLFLGSQLVNPRVRRVDAFSGIITTVAGNGTVGFSGDGRPATSAELDDPIGIAVDHFGNMFIGDSANSRVREVRLPPFVALSPTNVTFPAQVVGKTSKPRAISVMNTGTAILDISEVTIGGVDPGDFAQTNSCRWGVESRESCHISVTFTPKGAGTRTATLTITDNAPDSPRTVALSGTGSI